MDNLTHSLFGAVLGQLGLKRNTRLALPALIIGANLPDIDAVTTLLGVQSLALRRGLTHGPIAMLLLPLALTAALLAFDRWRERRRSAPVPRPPLRWGWLLGLAYIGTLSHPLLDWFNSYGIRLLEPFSSRWFAADTLFIIDVWLWAALVAGVWWSIRLERRGDAAWRMPALMCVLAMAIYVAANGLISRHAVSIATLEVERAFGRTPSMVVANPVPVAFWRRRMLWRCDHDHGFGDYMLPGHLTLDPQAHPHGMPSETVETLARSDAGVRAYMFWSRMPVERRDGDTMVLQDQRFMHSLAQSGFTLRRPSPQHTPHPALRPAARPAP
jgi:inner membrane protein